MIPKRLRFLGVTSVVLLLFSCSGTGNTSENLVPLPNLLRGTVANNTYYAPDQSFSIATPHISMGNENERYEWTHAKVLEGEKDALTFVKFGPFSMDTNRYGVDVFAKLHNLGLGGAAKDFFKLYMKGKPDEFETLAQMEIQIEGRRALYYAYRHLDQWFVLVATFIDFGDRYAMVFAVLRPLSAETASDTDLRLNAWERYNRFVRSLRVPAGSS